jgi:hypothetical protein
VLLVAPTVIACAAAVPIGGGKAYNNAHATSPNNAFCKRDSSPAIECPQSIIRTGGRRKGFPTSRSGH